MTTFLLAYRAPKDYVVGQEDNVAAWRAFFRDLGDHIADLGNPVFERAVVGASAADTVLGGYSLITADDLDEAAALAHGCPLIALGGSVEVGVIAPVGQELTAAMADQAVA